MKKLVYILVCAVLIGASVVALQSCEKEDFGGIDEFAASLTPICISEIPEGVIPMEFATMREAKAFFEKLEREIGKNSFPVQVQQIGEQEQFDLLSSPRLRSGVEQGGHGSHTTYNVFHDFLSITAYISYEYVGGPIQVSSSASGVTVGFRWKQKNASGSWSLSSEGCIWYTIDGIGIWYAFVKLQAFEIGRTPRTIRNLWCR